MELSIKNGSVKFNFIFDFKYYRTWRSDVLGKGKGEIVFDKIEFDNIFYIKGNLIDFNVSNLNVSIKEVNVTSVDSEKYI